MDSFSLSEANACVESLVEEIISDLEDIPGSYANLENCWEEICVQRQSEEFFEWSLYEAAIEGAIHNCFKDLPRKDKLLVNYAALEDATDIDDDEVDYDCLYVDEINSYLYKKVLLRALNDRPPRVKAFFDDDIEEEDDQQYVDKYLVLRIDPSRREDYLTMLRMIDGVQLIELEEDAVPIFKELLDSLNVEDE
ncbi:hypothetical protein GCM10023189_39080 [Nibrella saemangeumensis]|uniref:Uncharacterized protein n=1 Tax=Nibrella saemangeumensis TaxID=1084526 RepID=A0ABP8NA01_9BACT